jgi:subtilisin family serine protease
MRADEWFADLKALSHTFLDKYQTDDLSNDRNFRRVRIAILDTGIAFRGTASAPVPELIKENIGRVKLGKALDKSLPPHEDTNGHGTHAAGLILQVCPYANIYIYRVLRGEEPISHKLVTEALIDAIDKKKVDIVSMSLGWNEDSDEDLRAVIDRAKTKNVLIFAATSNEGIRRGIAYPARADEVIAIDAADVYGSPSKFNPPQGEKTQRFMVLGEAVRSAWPTSLNDDWNEEGWKRMSGTSFATPIAAAIAGLILEFSRQRPLCFDKKVENHLKSVAGMREVFSKLFSLKTADSSHFKYLDPFQLFHCISREEAGGEWYENLSPRLHAVSLK